MIRRLVSVALQQPLFILMLLALFVAGGVAAFRSLPVEAFPDVTDVQVTVITLFPGHAPEEVEKQITFPVEQGGKLEIDDAEADQASCLGRRFPVAAFAFRSSGGAVLAA